MSFFDLACVTSCLMFQPARVGTIVLVDHDILQKIDTETMTYLFLVFSVAHKE